MPIFASSGGAFQRARRLFVHDGAAYRTVRRAWVHDGSAWRLAFTAVTIISVGVTYAPADGFNGYVCVVQGNSEMASVDWTAEIIGIGVIGSGNTAANGANVAVLPRVEGQAEGINETVRFTLTPRDSSGTAGDTITFDATPG